MLGATGSGRGDVATFLGREFGFSRIHATVLAEREAELGSADGKVIAKCLANKRTCPMDVSCRVVKAEMLRVGGNKFLLDGFPRMVSMGYPMVHDQAFYLEENLGRVTQVISLDCTKAKKVERCGDADAVNLSLIHI